MSPWDIAAVREQAKTPPTEPQRQLLATEMDGYRRLATDGARLVARFMRRGPCCDHAPDST
ncbi:hypothetical protein [Streptomyces sp. NPDC093598]|uniref:hypothetical protein n=1 Tax=Streptomyces sp. NPDC093598 TaxID=3366046 RepID=UPI00382248BA